jgi:hypothetical protein
MATPRARPQTRDPFPLQLAELQVWADKALKVCSPNGSCWRGVACVVMGRNVGTETDNGAPATPKSSAPSNRPAGERFRHTGSTIISRLAWGQKACLHICSCELVD